MTHNHQFQEIPLTIHRDKKLTHYRCLECRAIYAIKNGHENELPGEIIVREGIDDGALFPPHVTHTPKWSLKDAPKLDYADNTQPWKNRCIVDKKGE